MEDDSDSQSVLEALVPGEEGAVGDGKPWKGEAEGDLTPGEEGAVGDGEPWKGKAKGDLPIQKMANLPVQRRDHPDCHPQTLGLSL